MQAGRPASLAHVEHHIAEARNARALAPRTACQTTQVEGKCGASFLPNGATRDTHGSPYSQGQRWRWNLEEEVTVCNIYVVTLCACMCVYDVVGGGCGVVAFKLCWGTSRAYRKLAG